MPLYRLDEAHLATERTLEVAPFFDDAVSAAAHRALGHFSIEPRTAIAITPEGKIDWPVTDFSVVMRRRMRSEATAHSYAREAEVFSRFLRDRLGKEAASATEDDFWTYRRLRLDGPLAVRVAPATWNRIAAALIRFQKHLRIGPELRWREYRAAASDSGKVRMIGLEQFLIFRDEGMALSPRHPQRNVAYAELLVTTGMRCTECAHLLLPELVDYAEFGDARMVPLELPASITKRARRRTVWYSRRVACGAMRDYLDEERSHLAHQIIEREFGNRKQTQAGLASLPGWIFVILVSREKVRIVSGPDAGLVKPLSVFGPTERARLVRVAAAARGTFVIEDFLALWLSERRPVVCRAGWNAVFDAASARAGGPARLGRKVSPHTLRHTFAVRQLHHLLLGLVELRTIKPLRDQRGEIYERIIGDPLRTLQELLGHASYTSTRRYLTYMEDNVRLVEAAVAQWEADLGG